jgi:hypothetical protein
MSQKYLNASPFFAETGKKAEGELRQDTSEMNIIFIHSRNTLDS